MVDFLIVGCGLAGVAFAETALQNNKSVIVFDDNSQTSSTVAAGLYNPVILKRFSGLQNSQQQLVMLQSFYDNLEARLKVKINYKMPVLRRFSSIEEQNNWFIAADKPSMADYLSTNIINDTIIGISSDFGFGAVLQTGYVDTAALLLAYKKFLSESKRLTSEKFLYGHVEFKDDFVHVGDIQARNIIFAEGFGLQNNPFFNYLPLDGTKGELLTIKAPNLELTRALNSSIFILPIGNNLFKVGATYNWIDKTSIPTTGGKSELVEKLREVITCDYEIVDHQAGVRPTVRDRKPLLGTHPIYKKLHVFNGLGTRGVMLGPYMANELFQHINAAKLLDRENDIARFSRFYPEPYCIQQKS